MHCSGWNNAKWRLLDAFKISTILLDMFLLADWKPRKRLHHFSTCSFFSVYRVDVFVELLILIHNFGGAVNKFNRKVLGIWNVAVWFVLIFATIGRSNPTVHVFFRCKIINNFRCHSTGTQTNFKMFAVEKSHSHTQVVTLKQSQSLSDSLDVSECRCDTFSFNDQCNSMHTM